MPVPWSGNTCRGHKRQTHECPATFSSPTKPWKKSGPPARGGLRRRSPSVEEGLDGCFASKSYDAESIRLSRNPDGPTKMKVRTGPSKPGPCGWHTNDLGYPSDWKLYLRWVG